MVKLDIAQEKLLKAVKPLATEEVPLTGCWRRVLSEDVVADIDFPPFDRSFFDGYAVVAAEVAGASPAKPVILKAIDNIPAGSVSAKTIRSGLAARIMTGAPIPPGATGVVRLEDVAVDGDLVKVLAGKYAAKGITPQGEEFRRGEKLINTGTVINSGVMGILAILGRERPRVYRRPQVALVGTGSEIVAVGAPLLPGKIRNSNNYLLAAQVAEAGADAVVSGFVRDDVDAIGDLLQQAAADVVVTTGGASLGDYDLIKDVFLRLGVTLLFDGVYMKPGMHVVAGVKAGKPFLGLSGNPVAASISFEMLARPMLLKMSGRTQWRRPQIRAILTVPLAKRDKLWRVVWSRCRREDDRLLVEPLNLTNQTTLTAAINANALAIIPEDSSSLPAGTELEVLMLADI